MRGTRPPGPRRSCGSPRRSTQPGRRTASLCLRQRRLGSHRIARLRGPGQDALRPGDLHDDKRRRVRVLSLTDNVKRWITAAGNDLAYEEVFSQQLRSMPRPATWQSPSAGRATAPTSSRPSIGPTSGIENFRHDRHNGGRLKQIQHGIHVDLADMGMVESIHASILHWVVEDYPRPDQPYRPVCLIMQNHEEMFSGPANDSRGKHGWPGALRPIGGGAARPAEDSSIRARAGSSSRNLWWFLPSAVKSN